MSVPSASFLASQHAFADRILTQLRDKVHDNIDRANLHKFDVEHASVTEQRTWMRRHLETAKEYAAGLPLYGVKVPEGVATMTVLEEVEEEGEEDGDGQAHADLHEAAMKKLEEADWKLRQKRAQGIKVGESMAGRLKKYVTYVTSLINKTLVVPEGGLVPLLKDRGVKYEEGDTKLTMVKRLYRASLLKDTMNVTVSTKYVIEVLLKLVRASNGIPEDMEDKEQVARMYSAYTAAVNKCFAKALVQSAHDDICTRDLPRFLPHLPPNPASCGSVTIQVRKSRKRRAPLPPPPPPPPPPKSKSIANMQDMIRSTIQCKKKQKRNRVRKPGKPRSTGTSS